MDGECSGLDSKASKIDPRGVLTMAGLSDAAAHGSSLVQSSSGKGATLSWSVTTAGWLVHVNDLDGLRPPRPERSLRTEISGNFYLIHE